MHCLVLLFVDLVLIAVSTLAAIMLCSAPAPLSALAAAGPYGVVTLAVAVAVLVLLGLNRTVWRFTSLGDIIRVACAVGAILVFANALGIYFGLPVVVSQAFPVMQGLLMLYALGGVRAAMRVRHDLRKRTRHSKSLARVGKEHVLVIGLGPLTDLFLSCAARNRQGRIEIVGILSESGRHRGRSLRSCKILGRPDAVEAVLHDLAVHGVFIDRIVMASPFSELTENAQTALRQLQQRGDVRFVSLSADYGLGDSAAGVPEFSAVAGGGDVELPPNSYLRQKRLIDAIVALMGAIILFPVMLVVTLAVLLDSGMPVIFWQQRPGARGRPIKVLKFRTMGSARDRDGRALADEERVSKFGRLLRRLRLDELPQVYNVLFGHMSLVGPRPLLPVDQPSAPAARLQLRPGLTGWAQIKGGRHLSREDKAALDLWYINNASLSLDLLILAQIPSEYAGESRAITNCSHLIPECSPEELVSLPGVNCRRKVGCGRPSVELNVRFHCFGCASRANSEAGE
jgi:lipopolysaccharide/colanic/teichoic acid biosynthesis glycosyltransferase